MLTVRYSKPGEPSEVLSVVESPMPVPAKDELLLKMLMSPVVPADLATIRGLYRTPQTLPASPGYSADCEVVEIGSEVSSFKVGARVLVLPFKKPGWTNGCWQQYFTIKETELIEIPDGPGMKFMPDFFNTSLTAWLIVVEKLRLAEGQTLLLTAAGSNVGQMIINLSKVRGYKVIAVVRRPEQVEEMIKLGAAAAICSTTEDIQKSVMSFTGLKGVDAVIDAVGGEIAGTAFRLLKDGGKMIAYGLLEKERNAPIDIRKMLFYNLSISGFWLPGWWFSSDLKTRADAIGKAMQLTHEGILTPVVEHEYSISQIKEAVSHAEKPGNKGRIFLKGN